MGGQVKQLVSPTVWHVALQIGSDSGNNSKHCVSCDCVHVCAWNHVSSCVQVVEYLLIFISLNILYTWSHQYNFTVLLCF
jgi:hypothetical protein